MKIYDLLKELFNYSRIRTSNVSSEAKSILGDMRTEFDKIKKSEEINKQAKMIALFIGGTILALKQDDWKYHYDFVLYPKAASNEVLKNVTNSMTNVESMYSIGNEALSNLPNLFNGALFEREERLVNNTDPVPFFPDLKINADKVDLLVKFCIKYSYDLERSEVDIEDLVSVELVQNSNANKAINTSPKPLLSNITMQILGGFIAAAGIAAIATAFVALNAATFGLAGLITAGVGVALLLGGLGLFATGTYRSCQTDDKFFESSIIFA
ncbi:MAG: hypothetical protein H0T84_08265 [Tatlockia sp.]|nr:hypothetical protein [Tatlockia sp.]